eukprot:1870094-Amphidinium_carterae.2
MESILEKVMVQHYGGSSVEHAIESKNETKFNSKKPFPTRTFGLRRCTNRYQPDLHACVYEMVLWKRTQNN